MLKSTIAQSRFLVGSGSITVSTPKMRLGHAGRCPAVPTLTIILFDDSGSVAMPGGTDPIGNRYAETRAAFKALQVCDCMKCSAAIRHFDTPHADAGPSRLGQRRSQAQLANALCIPASAEGSSLITNALAEAERIASQHPHHASRLVVFTDWDLFDPPGYIERLIDFPGTVLAVGVGANVPSELKGANVTALRVDYSDKPGAVARAVFRELVSDRPGSAVLETGLGA